MEDLRWAYEEKMRLELENKSKEQRAQEEKIAADLKNEKEKRQKAARKDNLDMDLKYLELYKAREMTKTNCYPWLSKELRNVEIKVNDIDDDQINCHSLFFGIFN